MTAEEAINRCDNLKPNQYSAEDKIQWLNDIENQIKIEIIDTHEGFEDVAFHGYTVENMDAELIAKPPYSDLYIKYLMAQIDFCNGETSRYNNSALMFNMAYQSFASYYNRTHMPLGIGEIKV